MQFDLDNAKIKKPTAYELVYEQIKNAIVSGVWRVGERLPSEPVLADKFGVNRLTVRMAIQKMNALGILETKVGDGTYVKDLSIEHYFQEISPFYLSPELLECVSEFRIMIELGCARLAMDRATEDEIRELETACDGYEEQCHVVEKTCNEKTLAVLAERDLKVHSKIVELSHNELCVLSYSAAKEAIYQYMILNLERRIDGWRAKNELYVDDRRHRGIVDAIKMKDYEKCRAIMTEVIDLNVDL